MTKQDKMKINNLLVRIKQIEDEIERLRLFDNQIEANYNRVFDWCVTNRTMLDEQCRKIGDLKAENEQLKEKLNARLTCDFVKTAQTHAVQDFADKVKAKSYVNDYCREVVKQEQEIARLKDENKQLHTNADILARSVRDLDHENYELTEHIEHLETQNAEEIKILLVEDGSIDFDDLAMFIDEHDLKIKIVVYRQGAVPARFLKQSEVEE